ncbi:hypothetical protein ACFXKY_15610 [Streptomyces canus]|uniref:hypothetical protein n=1 Tax=Streptomyces canus TaxID=58343 RepID=UPI0036C9990C
MKIIRRTVTALTLTTGALLVATPAYAAPATSPPSLPLLESFPLLGVPVAGALRALEGVVDAVAYAALSILPTK